MLIKNLLDTMFKTEKPSSMRLAVNKMEATINRLQQARQIILLRTDYLE
ncbi:hypothetical protein NVT87_05080 [Acinetobacter radioresistens]|jgi:hypothetical protein|nr:hypothetical protein [Acinetobacter radioresistens]MCK4080380.1 hypothetical protein [Acinetobacter radioresistens]MCK4086933.1 hypothetical protein [Acinetobacter radioresistens]MCK4108208.1 hypothetical protein [Acinetobacter radioresistens]MCU4500296.1 hypothetical protein [Acinetobacter radioresistens]MCX0330275.1 hypothetical protein [Acinetobacter radioresistens]